MNGSRVHNRSVGVLALAVALLAAAGAPAQAPPGLTSWGSQTYTLTEGEAVNFRVDWDQIPVRRWVLLVEGDLRISHLNVRRVHDGSLLYDQRDESRHRVDVPWGEGESLSGVLTAGRAGAYAISIWGPPRDDYLRAYSYGVNRALEALDEGDRIRARALLMGALRDDPADPVAQTLMRALSGGEGGEVVGPTAGEEDPEARAKLEEARQQAAALRAGGAPLEAMDLLQRALSPDLGPLAWAEVYGDLVEISLDLGNLVQARAALAAAEALGLPDERLQTLRSLVASAPTAGE